MKAKIFPIAILVLNFCLPSLFADEIADLNTEHRAFFFSERGVGKGMVIIDAGRGSLLKYFYLSELKQGGPSIHTLKDDIPINIHIKYCDIPGQAGFVAKHAFALSGCSIVVIKNENHHCKCR